MIKQLADHELLDKVTSYLCEDLTSMQIGNNQTKTYHAELKDILNHIDVIDVASIITHYENESISYGAVPRLKHFAKQLETTLGINHEVCKLLRNTHLYRTMKKVKDFHSGIVINLDSPTNLNQPSSKLLGSEIEEQLDSLVFTSPKVKKELDKVDTKMVELSTKKRQRSKLHKQRKNERGELNKAKRDLMNSMNL